MKKFLSLLSSTPQSGSVTPSHRSPHGRSWHRRSLESGSVFETPPNRHLSPSLHNRPNVMPLNRTPSPRFSSQTHSATNSPRQPRPLVCSASAHFSISCLDCRASSPLQGKPPSHPRSPAHVPSSSGSPRSSISPSPPTPSSPRRNRTVHSRHFTPVQEPILLEFAPLLIKWTSLSTCRLLYNSRTEEFSARQLNAKIGGAARVMLVVTTEDDDVFGCYYPLEIPVAGRLNTKVDCSKGHFIFTVQHPLHQPFRSFAKSGEKCLTLHSANDTDIVVATAGFWIKSDARLYVYPSVSVQYRLPQTVINPFTRTMAPSFSMVKSFVAFQWD